MPIKKTLLALALALVLAYTVVPVQGQGGITWGCPDPNFVKSILLWVQWIIFGIAVLIPVLLILAEFSGVLTPNLRRFLEFYNAHLMVIVSMFVIWFLFFYGIDNVIPPAEPGTECATIDLHKLFTDGPLIYQLIGKFAKLLGIQL